MTANNNDLDALMASNLENTTNRLVLADALIDAGREDEAALVRDLDRIVVVHDDEICEGAMYEIEMRDEYGSVEREHRPAADSDHANEIARERVEDWVREGDWGDDGAVVAANWTVYEDDEEVRHGEITVEIEPDHEALIRRATRGSGCGDDPDDHDWTSEGEGGCDQNPGVWSTGGTGLSIATHCRVCGLRRVEYSCGSQRDPGQHDTVQYEMPDEWCAE